MVPALRLASDNSSSDWGVGGSSQGAKPGNGHARKHTILVVEDEVIIRLSIADYLRECGYRVLEAADAKEAQTVLQAGEPIEIVFSDINMPGEMNGFGLASWVRDNYPDVRIILTSGVSHKAVNVESEYGPLLQKPYPYEAVLAQIKKTLLGG